MSLIAIGLRIAAVEALKGNTLVGEGVLDSEIGAIDVNAAGDIQLGRQDPFLTVYTQSASTSGGANMPRPFTENGMCEVLFEMGYTALMAEQDPETGEKEIFADIPVTDAEMEFYLDLLGRQIFDVLGDPNNEWAALWRGLVPEVHKIERQRAQSTQAVKVAAHQIKITCEVVPEPLVGQVMGNDVVFEQLLQRLEAHEDARRRAQVVQIRSILAGTPLSAWDETMMRMGLGDGDAAAMGVNPMATDDGSVGEAEQASLYVDGLGAVDITDEQV